MVHGFEGAMGMNVRRVGVEDGRSLIVFEATCLADAYWLGRTAIQLENIDANPWVNAHNDCVEVGLYTGERLKE